MAGGADVAGVWLSLGVIESGLCTDGLCWACWHWRWGRRRFMGRAAGFGVTVAPLVSDAEGDFSSTAIREALGAGRPEAAARVLGHWHRIEGEVEHGDKRGRALGFPTANIDLAGLHLPRFGVYAVLIDVLTGSHAGRYRSVASIGVRPTFGAGPMA